MMLTADEQSSKHNGAALVLHNLSSDLRGVSTRAEEGGRRPLKDLSVHVERFGFVVVTRSDGPVAELGRVGTRLDHVDVSKVGVVLVDLLAEVGEDLDVVWVVHSLEVGVWGESDRDFLLADRVGAGLDRLENESGSVLLGPSVLVGSVVGRLLRELVEQVPVCRLSACHTDPHVSLTGTVQLDTVKASLDGVLGRLGKRLLVSLDVLEAQRGGLLPVTLPGSAGRARVVGNVTRRDDLDPGRASVGSSQSPELDKDRSAFRVDPVSDLFPLLDVLLGVESRGVGVPARLGRGVGCLKISQSVRGRVFDL